MQTKHFGILGGQEWEDICNKLFHLRYKDNYQEVPAKYGGDYGIEGFTFDGLVFQCYCPEDENSSSKSLYELQRDKMTKDIKKLIDNIHKIRGLNKNILIKEWHFVTPRFDSKFLIEHCRQKEKEVLEKIKNFVDKDFRIIIQTEESYIEEMAYLVNGNFHEIQSQVKNYSCDELKKVVTSENEVIQKIKTKLLKLDGLKTNQVKLEKFAILLFKSFLEGKAELTELSKNFPKSYEKLLRLKNSVEKDIEQESILGIELRDIKKIQTEYKKTLEKEFGTQFEQSLIERLAQEAISDWIERCPLSFE